MSPRGWRTHDRRDLRVQEQRAVLTHLLGTLIGIFITSSGIIVAADTASTQSARPGRVTSERKIEMTGDHSGAALSGKPGWTAEWTGEKVTADLVGVFRAVSVQLRQAKSVPIATQVETLTAALKREAEANVFPAMEAWFPDGDLVTVYVAGYEGSQPVIHYATLHIDLSRRRVPPRFTVRRQQVLECWLLARQNAVALGLIDSDPRLPESLRSQPSVAVLQGFKQRCHGPLTETDARTFFLIALDATIAHGAKFGIPAGVVGGDLDVLRIAPALYWFVP